MDLVSILALELVLPLQRPFWHQDGLHRCVISTVDMLAKCTVMFQARLGHLRLYYRVRSRIQCLLAIVLHRKQPKIILLVLAFDELLVTSIYLVHCRLFHLTLLFHHHFLNDINQFSLVLLRLLQIFLQQPNSNNQPFQFVAGSVIFCRCGESVADFDFQGLAYMLQFLINFDEVFSNALNEGVERSTHIFLELQDHNWYLVGGLDKGSVDHVVGDGEQILILGVEIIHLADDDLVLKVVVGQVLLAICKI